MVFAIAAPEVLGKVVGRDKGQNVSFEALQGHLPTPLRLAVFADSRVGWVVASLSV